MSPKIEIIILIFGSTFIFLSVIFLLDKFKLTKFLKNAKKIFLNNASKDTNLINSGLNSDEFIKYLKDLLENKTEEESLIELSQVKLGYIVGKTINYLKFIPSENKIQILLDPQNINQSPIDVPYSDVEKVILSFKSFTERSGGKKTSTTYHYNNYMVSLKLKNNLNHIYIYNKIFFVSEDKGFQETESRAIGETLAKIFKVNLIRISGEEVEYNKLDQSVIEKIRDFTAPHYSFKRKPFLIQENNDNYCINELKYYNVLKIVLGIIAIVILNIIIDFVTINNTLLNVKNSYAKEFSPFYIILILSLITTFFGLLIFLWIKFSTNKVPKLKPIILIYKDAILFNLKHSKDQILKSSKEVPISKIEEIDVRYETSLGYSVKLITDEESFRIVSYYDKKKSNFLRALILDTIKKMNS